MMDAMAPEVHRGPAQALPRATCPSAYWLSKQQVEDGAGTLAARRQVASENAGWRMKEMNARPDVTCGGMGANKAGHTAQDAQPVGRRIQAALCENLGTPFRQSSSCLLGLARYSPLPPSTGTEVETKP